MQFTDQRQENSKGTTYKYVVKYWSRWCETFLCISCTHYSCGEKIARRTGFH